MFGRKSRVVRTRGRQRAEHGGFGARQIISRVLASQMRVPGIQDDPLVPVGVRGYVGARFGAIVRVDYQAANGVGSIIKAECITWSIRHRKRVWRADDRKTACISAAKIGASTSAALG